MKKFTSLMVVALFLCLTANAQFTTTVERYANTDYSTVDATFKLSEVATAVGTDAATLAQAIDDFENEENADTQLFGIPSDDGTTTNTGYNCDGRGSYWLAADGSLSSWGAGAFYNSLIGADVDADEFYIPLGNHPETTGTATLNFVLQYNGKKATFAITYIVNPLPDVDAAPETVGELTIVGNAAIASEQAPNSTYASKPASGVIADMAEKLGLDPEVLSAAVPNMVYARMRNTEYGLLTDTLVAISAYSDGWTQETLTTEGENSGILGANVYGDGDDLFLQGWAWDIIDGTFSFNVGQFPSGIAAGDVLTCNLYVCNGNKAYQVDYTFTAIEAATEDLSQMTQVGYADINVSQSPTTGYEASNITVDVDEIAAALQCETAGISLRALAEPGKLSTESTANNGGWWFSAEGFVHAYSGATYYIEPAESNDYSTLHIGQMPSTCQVGDVYPVTLYALNAEAGTYYAININFSIVEKADDGQDQFTSVATRNITIQQLVDTDYAWSDGVTIPNSQIYELLGISGDEVTLYGTQIDSIAAETGKAFTDEYTCTPYPGFWLTQDGKRTSWNDNSYWGISTGVTTDQDGVTFNAIQFPGMTNIGDTFNGKFYLVNLDTKQMITVNLTFQVVETLDDIEEVGNINVTVPVSTSDAEVEFTKLPEIAAAIGVDDILDGYYLRGIQANGQWSDAVSAINGLTFTTEGYVASMENIGIFFDEGIIGTYSNSEIAEGWKAEAQICFQANNKRYIINLVLMNADDYAAGINTVNANAQNGKIYTIGGVETTKMVKGVYIQNGKKVVVK